MPAWKTLLENAHEIILNFLFGPDQKSAARHETLKKFITSAQATEIIFTNTAKRRDILSRHGTPALLSITSLLPYREPAVAEAIWELKYRGDRAISEFFAKLLYDYLADRLLHDYFFFGAAAPLLIPIPSSSKRRTERGFNQTERLADALARLDHDHFFIIRSDILIKSRETAAQAKLPRSERLSNLINCFSLRENAPDLSDKNILLLDDVATTGSTLEEAASAMRAGGARSVYAITIAH